MFYTNRLTYHWAAWAACFFPKTTRMFSRDNLASVFNNFTKYIIYNCDVVDRWRARMNLNGGEGEGGF